MWYIVKTDLYRERDAICQLLQLDGVDDIYFPNIRQEIAKIESDEKSVSFSSAISGILFVYAKNLEQLKKNLDFRGYFNEQSGRVAGNAHVFSMNSKAESLDEILSHAAISDEEIYRYKVCIEQCAAHTDDIKIVGKNFAELVSENDTVMITDGPFVGQTGVIKQVKSHGVKDRCLFYGLGGLCVQLAGIRRYGVIVVRESAKGTKAQLPNTWRYIDYLLGKLQASFFADTASAALRHILEQYNKVKDVEKCQTLLLAEAKAQRTETQGRELALQALWLQQIGDEELGALKSLNRFFQSQDNSVSHELIDLIPDMTLRPFLTPTSGVEMPKSKNYILFRHNNFVELICRVNLKKEFQKAEHYPALGITDVKGGRYTEDGKLKGKMRKGRPFQLSAKEYVYYVHVGLMASKDGEGITAMVNWGEFTHRYLSLSEEERQVFLDDLSSKGYQETHRLLSEAQVQDESPTLSGFICHIPDVTLEGILARYERAEKFNQRPLSLLRTFVPVAQLVRRCIPSAVEFWQRQRLLEWRHLVQRFVLLHNLPLSAHSKAPADKQSASRQTPAD